MSQKIIEIIGDCGADFTQDPLGNLTVTLDAKPGNPPLLFLCPADEPGYYVTCTDGEKAYFAPVSGAELKKDLKRPLLSSSGARAAFVTDDEETPAPDNTFIKCPGAEYGDTLSAAETPKEKDGALEGVNIKNRAAAAVMCSVIKNLPAKRKRKLIFVFCFSEETMYRGGKCAASGKDAEKIIAFSPSDIKGADRAASTGGGAALTIKDKTTVYSQSLNREIQDILSGAEIPHMPVLRSDRMTFPSLLPLADPEAQVSSLGFPFEHENGSERIAVSDLRECEKALLAIAQQI